eukprot:2217186-Prymnesium_polylepis.1
MMRHSKKQADALGNMQLPECTVDIVQLNFAHSSENAVYLAIEAYCQEEAHRMMTHTSPNNFKADLEELIEMLQGAATHVSLIQLDRLEDRLNKTLAAGRVEMWNLGASSGDRNRHSKGLLAPACLLLDVVLTTERSEPGYSKLEQLFKKPSEFSCAVCSTNAEHIIGPVIVDCCQ